MPVYIMMINSKTFCQWTHKRVQIKACGGVGLCCYHTDPIGNVFEKSLEEIWQSKIVKEIREVSEQNKMHPQCKKWSACPYIDGGRPLVLEDVVWSEEGPTEMEICLPNTHCNIGGIKPNEKNPACIMCPRNFPFHPEPSKTLEIAERVKHHMSRLEILFIGGVAEPFWKGLIFDVLRVMEFEKHAHKCELHTVNNGTLLTDETADKLISIAPKFRLCTSLDAATPETFQKIRRLKTFDKIIQNLTRLCAKTSELQVVEIHNNINLMNVKELPAMVRLTKKVGADLIGINVTHNPGFGSKDIKDLDHVILNPSNSYIFEEYYDKAVAEAERIGVKLIAYKQLKAEQPKVYQIKLA
jgi:MoaA/NifB/PqqE/SkfB family radical SAM enzyme